MELTGVQKMGKLLRTVVKIALVCNVLSMLIAPSVLYLGKEDLLFFLKSRLLELTGHPGEDSEPMFTLLFGGLVQVWQRPEAAAHTVFLWICGSCTLVILWQALAILNTILRGDPFQIVNARALKNAAMACWVVSATAVIRLVVELAVMKNAAPIFTYNAVFIPAFLAGGLLFLVMSALFRQAAEMKEEQDLTI